MIAVLFAGCTLPWQGDGPATTTGPTSVTPVPEGPPLVFGGNVRDIIDGHVPEGATVRIDLAQKQPCQREGIVWAAWPADASASGRFGPLEVPRPKSNDVAFFVHATAPGYNDKSLFIGAAEARGDLGNLTLDVTPTVTLRGTAPPGTVIALEDSPFPRLTVADAGGVFVIGGAPALEASFVAGTDVPFTDRVRAPQNITVPKSNGTGWQLEGRLVTTSGAPMAADIVAWNGTTLWSAARASDSGVFVLPIAPQGVALRIEARTWDGHYGATLTQDVQGPPATRATLVMRALC
ncbi:MAG: hypothetical protein WDA16_04800 [Candidatus Thermoplasmatota archaeon]